MDRQAVISGLKNIILVAHKWEYTDYLLEAIKFLKKDEKLRADLTEFLEQENPYPKSAFMIIKKEDYDKINDFFKKELGYSMDRLSGNMGRNIYITITDILRGMIK